MFQAPRTRIFRPPGCLGSSCGSLGKAAPKMGKRLKTATLVAFAGCLATAGVAIGANAVAIYGNSMNSSAKRSQVVQVSGRNCDRGGSQAALRVTVGTRTDECIYRTPVVGRDLEISATERLLSGTPRSIRKGMFLALNLRNGGGGMYQLAVFPLQRKFQLRKDLPDGTRKFLSVGKGVKRIRGINKATELRLRAFNLTGTRDKDDCRLLVFIGGKRFAVVTDDNAGPLKGRYASVSVGSSRSAAGAVASFDDLLVRVPSPF